jgi:CO/xanthine dehydrogenase Mo-binding subunit
MNAKDVVGRATPRGARKVTDKGTVLVDMTLPGMLWGKVLRSPIPTAGSKASTSACFGLPGVKAVITGNDVAGLGIGRRIYDMPILVEDCVRFVGEKVAAVAADDASTAVRTLDLILAITKFLRSKTSPICLPRSPNSRERRAISQHENRKNGQYSCRGCGCQCG